jgi:hypothetical protein
MTQQVIVYRSQSEQLWDQFMWQHPDIMLYAVGAIVILPIIGWVYLNVRNRR